MDISVRHDIFYNFSSGIINVKNKEKNLFFFTAHFRKVFIPCPLTSIDLCPKFCAKWKAL